MNKDMRNFCKLCVFAGSIFLLSPLYGHNRKAEAEIVPASRIGEYVTRFNETDDELTVQLIPDSKAAKFLSENIPRFECPDRELEEIYYFRWWTFRKHIKQTPEGYIISEFLPSVGWAGKYNGISCAAMHHYNEGRWLCYAAEYPGKKYKRGKGLQVFVDGVLKGKSGKIGRLSIDLGEEKVNDIIN
jgi:hypothetical protein